MDDSLEKDIRRMFCDTGPLDRDEITILLLDLLKRIQQLENIEKHS